MPDNLENELASLIDKVVAVEKLRETRAFAGFTRLFYEVPEGMEDPQHQLWKDYPIDRNERWLPAAVTYGEGIFLSFNNDMLRDWSSRDQVRSHIEILQQNYDICVEQHRWSNLTLLPQFVFLHTLSHLLINELVFECGYGVSSIRERIYCSDEDSKEMSGILIYSATGDSEGTMGGLVKQSEPHLWRPAFKCPGESAMVFLRSDLCRVSRKRGTRTIFLKYGRMPQLLASPRNKS